MKEPQATDGILGGQTPPPINSATLGGIEGLQQQMTIAPPEQRSQLLSTALNYGEAGVDLVIATLNNDPILTVRATAYQSLQSVDSEKAKAAIANGILLNPGDQVYGVYKSAIQFNDEFFRLNPELQDLDFMNETNWEEFGYADYESFCTSEDNYNGGEIDSYIPKRVAHYISREEAEAAAEQLHQKLVSEWDYTGDFEERADFDLNEWCQANQVSSISGYGYLYDLKVELKGEGNYKLLAKLWRDAIGDFAFVREETVSEPQYLKL
ncbi:hypothetical protein K9N68_33365 [Kovacikia minuta CCNUW1]|uniref:hypothetical protein n=1 Tax=Kovacikia minuta TaxID=2931930 RepID=UPI001CCF8E35|nr:hypothetical protein [Kovacikia minuta]UBF26335.1 hypothetical protein K9N68_33365 [Kovacikia minuta CCNUW1]